MSEQVTVSAADVIPEAVSGTVGDLKPGDWLLDAHGGRHRIWRIRELKGGRRKLSREDGWPPETLHQADPITYVPNDYRVTRPARSLHRGDTVITAEGEQLLIKVVRQRMKGDEHTRVRYEGRAYADHLTWETFPNWLDVTFIPAPERRPVVGQGATEHLHTDKLGYVVTGVSESGNTAYVVRLKDPGTIDGCAPADQCNGFPVWKHVYTPEQLADAREDCPPVEVRRLRNGRWQSGRVLFTFEAARYFRNYAE